MKFCTIGGRVGNFALREVALLLAPLAMVTITSANENTRLSAPTDSTGAVTIDVQQADLPVFESGEGMYCRLPSILVTREGTVLAACQKRKGSRGDWAESALVLKRSTDGQSWSGTKMISKGGGYSDLAVLPDRTILVLYEQSRAAGLYLAQLRLTQK
jgi:hypothetical protein